MDSTIHNLPTDWRRVRLSEVAKIERGKFSHRPRNDPRFYGGTIPFVQTGDVTKSSGRIRSYSQTLNELGLSVSRTFQPGVVLITIAANIGYSGVLEFESACPDSLIGLTPCDAVDAYFLQLFLHTQQPDMDRLAPKGTQKNINIQFLKPWPIILPPLAEQTRIAKVLQLVRNAIDQQSRLIATTVELKTTLFNRLFTRGLRNDPQEETEIGLLPRTWRLKRCEDLCEAITVGVVVRPASHYVESGVPVFRSFNVREDRLVADDLVYFSETANNTILSKSKLRAGDVLVVRTGYPGTSCVVPNEFDGANCVDLVIVRPRRDLIRSGLLSRFFNSAAGKRQAVASKHGLAQQHLNVGAVKRTLIPVPTLEEQVEIEEVLSVVEQKLLFHTRKRDALSNLFDTLLHRLINSSLRVHDLDLSALDVAEV